MNDINVYKMNKKSDSISGNAIGVSILRQKIYHDWEKHSSKIDENNDV